MSSGQRSPHEATSPSSAPSVRNPTDEYQRLCALRDGSISCPTNATAHLAFLYAAPDIMRLCDKLMAERIPDGYALVPVSPTPEIIACSNSGWPEWRAELYRAMIQAGKVQP